MLERDGQEIETVDQTANSLSSITKKIAIAHPLQVYIEAATSNNTRKAYQQDIRHFIQWGGVLPASTDGVIHYLQAHAASLNTRTLIRRLTALKNWHIYQGFSDPTQHPLIKKAIKGIQYLHGKPKEKAPALTLEQLIQMVRHLQTQKNLTACRNNALLQIGFFGAFRRSELVAICWENVSFVKEGIEILIPRSKTDQIRVRPPSWSKRDKSLFPS